MDDNHAPAHIDVMGSPAASLDPTVISAVDAAHTLWFFSAGPAALRAGAFDEHLIQTIAHADTSARAALQAAFPGPAVAVRLATGDLEGLRLLTAIAGGER